MLKKLGMVLVLIVLLLAYFQSNGLFFGEMVKSVKGNKSSGEFNTAKNLPFIQKTGIYKTYGSDYDCFEIIKKYDAELVLCESVEGVTSYYFYSKKLPNKEVVKNKKVNLQIAVTNETIIIGSPIIYGGY